MPCSEQKMPLPLCRKREGNRTDCTARSRQPAAMKQAFLVALLPMLAFSLSTPSVSDALDVTTNITETQGTGNLHTHINPPHDNIYDITGGTRPGSGSILF